jgi:uncharacterized ferredoxin-like protein
MGRFKSKEVEREAVMMAVAMMAASARTAPKARGIDAVKTMVIDGAAAKKLRLLDSDIIIGIPLSATGKNIYFDRQ